MKAFTDLDQSKKLAEILPLDSADMSINNSLFHNMTMVLTTPYKKLHEFFSGDTPDTTLPCWSLAALLDILNIKAYSIDEDAIVELSSYKTIEWDLSISNLGLEVITESDPIDACYKMIFRLHEEKLL